MFNSARFAAIQSEVRMLEHKVETMQVMVVSISDRLNAHSRPVPIDFKISAIKLVRQKTGMGLVESKNLVEELVKGGFIQCPSTD